MLEEGENYLRILSDLSEQWLITEVSHRVSKQASSMFWKLANDMFNPLYLAKGDLGRKIPQFDCLRKKLYDENTPTVHMEIAYESKETGEVTVVEASSTPVSRFPPSTHRRLYEIAWVEVSSINFLKMFWMC